MAARALALAATRQQGWRSPEHYLRLARTSADRRGAVHEAAQNLLCEAVIALFEGKTAKAHHLCKEAEARFVQLNMAHFAERASSLDAQVTARSYNRLS
jgi:hypothetical protein